MISTPYASILTRSLCALLLAIPLAATAQIYKSVDEDGNVVFSDHTDSNNTQVEEVELPEINSAAPPEHIEYLPAESPLPDLQAAGPIVTITSPAPQTTIPMGPGNFAVTASVEPNLQSGELLQLKIDGTVWGEPQHSSSWQLTNIFRGEHTLVVDVVNQSGDIISSSEAVVMYVQRPSLNSPARPGASGPVARPTPQRGG